MSDELTACGLEMSEQKDLIPKAMKPTDFEALGEEHHLDQSIDTTDQHVKDSAQDKARFEKMKQEYEKLYTEFVQKQITTHK